jgi:hypothetical protein
MVSQINLLNLTYKTRVNIFFIFRKIRKSRLICFIPSSCLSCRNNTVTVPKRRRYLDMTNRLKKESILKRPIAFNKPFSVIFYLFDFFYIKKRSRFKTAKRLKKWFIKFKSMFARKRHFSKNRLSQIDLELFFLKAHIKIT